MLRHKGTKEEGRQKMDIGQSTKNEATLMFDVTAVTENVFAVKNCTFLALHALPMQARVHTADDRHSLYEHGRGA